MSIFTEIKKFNRKYTIITHMQDSALPAESEVLLEGVVVVYTPTGELKDAEKCKVGDGVTEFCNLPWLGGEEVVLEDLTAELQRQDELLTSIETFLNSIKTTDPVPEPEPTEPYWYFVYNRYPGIHTLEDGYVHSAADPWSWATEVDDDPWWTDYFYTSPVESYSLELLDKTKTYSCVVNADTGNYGDPYAKLTYGIPPKMWLFEDASCDDLFTCPWIYENHFYGGPEGFDSELYYPNGDFRVIAPGFDLNWLDPTIEYRIAFAGCSGGGILRFGYPVNND